MNERFSLELLRLVYDYVKNFKSIDYDFIDKIVEVMIDKLSLNNVLKKLVISEDRLYVDDNPLYADYNFNTKVLKVNFLLILEYEMKRIENFKFSGIEKCIYLYLVVLKVILHEIEHIYQAKKIKTNNDELETKILIPSLFSFLPDDVLVALGLGYSHEEVNLYFACLKSIYIKNYIYAPHERLAEYYPSLIALKILEELDITCNNLVAYENLCKCDILLSGYDKKIPTKYYFEQIGAKSDCKMLEKMKIDLSLEKRASLGLQVSDSELCRIRMMRETFKSIVVK